MITGQTIALTRWTFVGIVMSLLFNMLSRLIIAFLPKKEQVSFNFMAAVTICSDFGDQENYSGRSTRAVAGRTNPTPWLREHRRP